MLAHDELSKGFTNEYLATPIGSGESVSPREMAGNAARRLGPSYDQAPVSSHGRVVGYVLTDELAAHPQQRVSDLLHPRSEETTVQASAPIRDVLPMLRDHHFAFMNDGEDLVGFITPSDLNKQAARAYFYLLIAGLEITLAELIRDAKSLEEQEALAIKLPDRGYEVRGRYLVDKSEGREVDYVAYMSFPDLIRVVGFDRDFLHAVGASTPDRWRKTIGGLPQLRNAVMHSTRELASGAGDVSRLLRYEDLIREILGRLSESSGMRTLPAS